MSTSRRRFLQASLCASLPLVVGKANISSATEPPQFSFSLGLVTYQWGKDWDLPTLLENCRATGYSGVELRTGHKHGVDLHLSDEQRKQVRHVIEQSGVQLVGIGTDCEYHMVDKEALQKEIARTKEYVLLSHQLGGSGVKVRPNGLTRVVPAEVTIAQIGRALHEVSEFAREYDQEIRVEVHGPGTSEIPVMHQIMRAAAHENAVVCWNCNPTDLVGEGLVSNFQLLQDKIRTVHFHDLTRPDYPWPELFELLVEAEFNGWMLLEEGRVPEDIPAALTANQKAFHELELQARSSVGQ